MEDQGMKDDVQDKKDDAKEALRVVIEPVFAIAVLGGCYDYDDYDDYDYYTDYEIYE